MGKRSKRKNASHQQIPARIVADGAIDRGFSVSRLNRNWVAALGLVLAVILVYLPVWWAGYIWDDDYHLTANPCIVGPAGLKEIWTTSAGQFFPLVLTTFWVEHALWGLQPLPYHLVNVLQQATCAVLLWRVLVCLRVPGAWLGAALWTLHPLQVESVAWISEMKNTQSCLFYLLAILLYVRWLQTKENQGRGNWSYALTLIFAALAMASKSSTLVLPVVLALCAWWVGGRWHWRNLVGLTPILLMSAVASVVTMWPHLADPSAMADDQGVGSWPQRVATVGYVIWFYLGKLIWPHPLITIYPRWNIDASQGLSYLPLLLFVTILLVLWFKSKSWGRPYFFAFFYFVVALSPFLGLIDQTFWRYSFVEDHLQYLASIGPLALGGAGLARWSELAPTGKQRLRWGSCAGLLIILAVMSAHQASFYEDEETLWVHTLSQNPNCWLGYYNLGIAFEKKGQTDKAMTQYEEALKIKPNYAQAHLDLGNVFVQYGQIDDAMVQYQEVLRIKPNLAAAEIDLGNIFGQKGQIDKAIACYQNVLSADSVDLGARDVLGVVLLREKARHNLGVVLFRGGRVDEAIVQYRKVLEANPNDADTYYTLGNALLQKGQLDEAIAQYKKSIGLKPDNIRARNSLDNALLQREGR